MDDDRPDRQAVYLTNEAGFDQWASWATEKAFMWWYHEKGPEEGHGPTVVILRIRTDHLIPDRIRADLGGTEDARFFVTGRPERERALAVRYLDGIPPEHIEWAKARRFHHPDTRHHRAWSHVEIQGPWLRLR
jgi:hypothetical protein